MKLGDSLSRSIDKGLLLSKFGVVVISKNFIKKRWPEYELAGLNIRERAGKKNRIIPIRHGVSHKEVIAFSPSLADRLAGDTSKKNINEIAIDIIEVVRPDIFENLLRRAIFLQMLEQAPHEDIPLGQLKDKIRPGPIRHKTLPDALLVRIRIVHLILHEVFQPPLAKMINEFRRDAQPEKEIEIWERIAAAYSHLTGDKKLNQEQKEEIFIALLLATGGPISDQTSSPFSYVIPEIITDALENVVPKIIDEE